MTTIYVIALAQTLANIGSYMLTVGTPMHKHVTHSPPSAMLKLYKSFIRPEHPQTCTTPSELAFCVYSQLICF